MRRFVAYGAFRMLRIVYVLLIDLWLYLQRKLNTSSWREAGTACMLRGTIHSKPKTRNEKCLEAVVILVRMNQAMQRNFGDKNEEQSFPRESVRVRNGLLMR